MTLKAAMNQPLYDKGKPTNTVAEDFFNVGEYHDLSGQYNELIKLAKTKLKKYDKSVDIPEDFFYKLLFQEFIIKLKTENLNYHSLLQKIDDIHDAEKKEIKENYLKIRKKKGKKKEMENSLHWTSSFLNQLQKLAHGEVEEYSSSDLLFSDPYVEETGINEKIKSARKIFFGSIRKEISEDPYMQSVLMGSKNNGNKGGEKKFDYKKLEYLFSDGSRRKRGIIFIETCLKRLNLEIEKQEKIFAERKTSTFTPFAGELNKLKRIKKYFEDFLQISTEILGIGISLQFDDVLYSQSFKNKKGKATRRLFFETCQKCICEGETLGFSPYSDGVLLNQMKVNLGELLSQEEKEELLNILINVGQENDEANRLLQNYISRIETFHTELEEGLETTKKNLSELQQGYYSDVYQKVVYLVQDFFGSEEKMSENPCIENNINHFVEKFHNFTRDNFDEQLYKELFSKLDFSNSSHYGVDTEVIRQYFYIKGLISDIYLQVIPKDIRSGEISNEELREQIDGFRSALTEITEARKYLPLVGNQNFAL